MARQLSNVFEPPVPKQSGRLSSLPGGRPALFAFGLSLVAYTLQTEAAQYVQQGLGYRKPFLSLYLGHSGFTILLPLHLLFLRYTTKLPYSHYLHIIAQNLHWQLSTPTRHVEGKVQEDIRRRLSMHSGRDGRMSYSDRVEAHLEEEEEDLQSQSASRPSMSRPISFRDSLHLSHPHLASSIPGPPPYKSAAQRTFGFDLPKLILMLLTLMGAITVPALSWYCAVPMTSMADITALYNTFSVWALVFSVWFFGEKWSRYKVTSVLLACGGVIVVAYGGGEEGEHRRRPKELDPVYGKPSATSSASSAVLATSTVSGTGAERTPTQAVEARLAEIAQRETDARDDQVLEFVPRRPTAASATLKQARAETSTPSPSPEDSASNPLLGDLLALFGAITMAAYEMAFKLLGTLPDEEGQKKRWDRAQGGSSGAGRRSRAGSRAGSRPSSRHQRIVSGEADDEDEEEQLLAESEEQERDPRSKHSSKRGRKERNHVLGLSDAESPEAGGAGGSLSVPKQSTERSAIWSPSGDIVSPAAADSSGARVPPDYGSGASSPFLSIENGAFLGSGSKRASSADGGGGSRRGSRGMPSDPLSVEAVKDRLKASASDRRRVGNATGESRTRQSRARSALVSDEDEEIETETETETETESVLQSGDEEEILAGGTRLGRNRPFSSSKKAGAGSGRGAGKRRTVLFDQDTPYDHDQHGDSADSEEEDGEQDPDETLREVPRESRQHHSASSSSGAVARSMARDASEQMWIPPPLPFGLHANIMTTGIGVVTAGTLWIGVLVAHLTGWEPFELPHNAVTVFAILFVVFSGVIFNACFMLLLALWGPVTASVSCLLSTVAVAIFDALLRGAFSIVSLVGCCFIVGGFGLLMMEGGH